MYDWSRVLCARNDVNKASRVSLGGMLGRVRMFEYLLSRSIVFDLQKRSF